MASYSLFYRPSVEKDLKLLPKVAFGRVWAAIESLQLTPFPHGYVKLSGSEGLYRIRVGDYRIVYGVDHPSSSVLIHHVRHRKDVYRSL